MSMLGYIGSMRLQKSSYMKTIDCDGEENMFVFVCGRQLTRFWGCELGLSLTLNPKIHHMKVLRM